LEVKPLNREGSRSSRHYGALGRVFVSLSRSEYCGFFGRCLVKVAHWPNEAEPAQELIDLDQADLHFITLSEGRRFLCAQAKSECSIIRLGGRETPITEYRTAKS
jgi:hypothetical protein